MGQVAGTADKILGSDGTGFIVGPYYNLQPVTPVENILALYESAIGG